VNRNADPLARQYPEILRFVRRRAGSSGQAEDITQEAFASAAATLARSSKAAPPTLAWLYTIARRRLVDEARRRRPTGSPLELVGEVAARDDEYGGLVARALEAALAELGEAQRAVVVLRLLEGLSFAEIGTKLGPSEEACRVRFMRALRQIRAHFEKEGLTP
jgi:RNA polymerase sigma-70 factor (ECF subfamily)